MTESKEASQHKRDEYNQEQVYYCKDCLSLNIMCETIADENGEVKQVEDTFSDLCDECGSTNIGITTIEEWEKMWKEKYPNKPLPREKVSNKPFRF